MTFNPSPQQRDIFSAISRGDSNIIVDAKAGSGKTTTIVHGMSYIPSPDFLPPSCVFLAFNKSIADTLRSRCPKNVSCSTFHALGFRTLKSSGLVHERVQVDGRKCAKLVFNALGVENPDTRSVIRAVDLIKGSLPCFEKDFWHTELRRYDLSFENEERALTVALGVVEKSLQDLDTIDFNDMLFLPVLHDLSWDKYDWIFVDEAQDLNGIQHEIVHRIHGTSSQLVAVGDPFQAIYGFRGAHADSMSVLAARFGCVTYPLSVSYRCSKAVITEAQKILNPQNNQ